MPTIQSASAARGNGVKLTDRSRGEQDQLPMFVVPASSIGMVSLRRAASQMPKLGCVSQEICYVHGTFRGLAFSVDGGVARHGASFKNRFGKNESIHESVISGGTGLRGSMPAPIAAGSGAMVKSGFGGTNPFTNA